MINIFCTIQTKIEKFDTPENWFNHVQIVFRQGGLSIFKVYQMFLVDAEFCVVGVALLIFCPFFFYILDFMMKFAPVGKLMIKYLIMLLGLIILGSSLFWEKQYFCRKPVKARTLHV